MTDTTQTVLKRWVSVKIALHQECTRVRACFVEFGEMVKRETNGQKTDHYMFFIFEDAQFSVLRDRVRLPNCASYTVEDKAVTDHVPLPLGKTERFVEYLRTINTGVMLSKWEKTQAEA